MIRILGINSSPRIKGSHALYESHCAIMLQGLMDAIRESCNDCRTEIIHLSQMNIHPCRACFSDMETRCHYLCDCFDDDFSKVAQKMIEADGIFFASPTYMFGMAGILKLFLERWISFKAPPIPREERIFPSKAGFFFFRFSGDTLPIFITSAPFCPGTT